MICKNDLIQRFIPNAWKKLKLRQSFSLFLEFAFYMDIFITLSVNEEEFHLLGSNLTWYWWFWFGIQTMPNISKQMKKKDKINSKFAHVVTITGFINHRLPIHKQVFNCQLYSKVTNITSDNNQSNNWSKWSKSFFFILTLQPHLNKKELWPSG